MVLDIQLNCPGEIHEVTLQPMPDITYQSEADAEVSPMPLGAEMLDLKWRQHVSDRGRFRYPGEIMVSSSSHGSCETDVENLYNIHM